MSRTNSGEITALLKDWSNPDSLEKIIAMVYEDLRGIAHNHFRRRPGQGTLQATALVHEVYMHLADNQAMRFENRKHFLNTASLIMRQLLSKYARAQQGQKRGGGQKALTFEEALNGELIYDGDYLLAVDQCLRKLAEKDERKAQIVELRIYLGLTMEEIAEILEVNERTVRRDWQFLKRWLAKELYPMETEPEEPPAE